MPVQIEDNVVVAGLSEIPLTAFPELVRRHLSRYTTTRELEEEAATLRRGYFSEQDLRRFIQHVCTWGGYPGIAGRVLKENPIEAIKAQFHRALTKLESSPPDVQGALQSINCIRQLGSPSFASKHLRFLRPDICPILDTIVSNGLSYRPTTQGYKQLSEDCIRVAAALRGNQIVNPMARQEDRWFAADVEMALFAHLRKL